jgi:hypothetical protein
VTVGFIMALATQDPTKAEKAGTASATVAEKLGQGLVVLGLLDAVGSGSWVKEVTPIIRDGYYVPGHCPP